MQYTLTNTKGQNPLEAISAEVTQAIIDNSRTGSFQHCMVAEAIQEKYPTATYIHVDTSMIRFTLDGLRYYFIPPQAVKNNIAKFDAGMPVEPFKFRTAFRARVLPSGFSRTHPKGDNRTNPGKKYGEKKRNYPTRARINGVCITTPAQ